MGLFFTGLYLFLRLFPVWSFKWHKPIITTEDITVERKDFTIVLLDDTNAIRNSISQSTATLTSDGFITQTLKEARSFEKQAKGNLSHSVSTATIHGPPPPFPDDL